MKMGYAKETFPQEIKRLLVLLPLQQCVSS